MAKRTQTKSRPAKGETATRRQIKDAQPKTLDVTLSARAAKRLRTLKAQGRIQELHEAIADELPIAVLNG